MSKKKLFIGGGLLVIVLLIIGFSTLSGKKETSVPVQTATVDKQEIVETVNATGRIQPETQVKISADVAAKIINLPVEEGDWVEKGQLLVELDKERFEAAVESAQANLRALEANANLVKQNMVKARKDYERTKSLFDQQLESQATLDQMVAAYQVEKARYQSTLEQVDQAKAALKQANDDLSKTTIYSPMAGTISQLNKEQGEIALGSAFQEDVIMVVSNMNRMEALVDVDENDVVSVKIGDSARIEVDAIPGKKFNGVVTEIASTAKISGSGSADQKTEFEVKVAVIDAGHKLRPGMTASADIVTQTRDMALVVPLQAVTVRTPEQLKSGTSAESGENEDKQTYTPDEDGYVQVVFVVNNDRVKARQVKTGIQSDTHIEILDGLAEGDEIVTGNYRAISETLQNNTLVSVSRNRTGETELASR